MKGKEKVRRGEKLEPVGEVNKIKGINNEIIEVFKNYFKYSSRAELGFDIVIPVIISLLIFVSLAFLEPSNKQFLLNIKEVNNTSMAIMAILAGFNTTSLAIIATAGGSALGHLYQLKIKNNIVNQIITFFTFAIMSQIIILIFGIIILILSNSLQGIYGNIGLHLSWINIRIPLFVLAFLWGTFNLFSLFVSLRNVSLLYRYILFVAKKQ
ncbi:hypothetical protein MN093_14415 [Bacillus mycoides]|uniref:hypothetical protein n=1 Tax=Bacillus mycoides TaxID=1405 RepID=UPI00187A3B33|nr:hypothetical protein [Bacillus mycoides]MBE7148916.1 hypothetical protein [Bacillus mycoides]UNJ91726.1 hypothetical protein MN093_14415 [Bacillus mycoides]